VKRTLLNLCFYWIVALPYSFPASAQDSSAEPEPARETPYTLTLNKIVGLPGQEASLPVLFGRKSEAPNLSKLRFRVKYPAAVQFSKIADAYLSRRVGLQVEAKEENSGGNDRTLEVNLTLPDSSKEFPSGQIATIFFTIAAETPDQVIRLNPQTWIDGGEVRPDSPSTQIEAGEIRVSQTPVFVGCFFFTH
jgi:hypothetical protein